MEVGEEEICSCTHWLRLTHRRNFLLFIPTNVPNLKAILSYYSSTVTVNAEGDVHVSDETIEGIGTRKFLRTLFGSLSAFFPSSTPHVNGPQKPSQCNDCQHQYLLKQSTRGDSHLSSHPWDPGPSTQAYNVIEYEHQAAAVEEKNVQQREVKTLTDLLPEPGYFVAGGVAGVVSRTATAPLDRLKVYLIAQVGVKDEAISAAKSGAPIEAAKKATRPLLDATKQIWRMGGMRSMFAGSVTQIACKSLQLTHPGNGLNVVKVMPESAIKFGSYEVMSLLPELDLQTHKTKGLETFIRPSGRPRQPQKSQSMVTVLSRRARWHDLPVSLSQQHNRFSADPHRFAVYPLDTLKL